MAIWTVHIPTELPDGCQALRGCRTLFWGRERAVLGVALGAGRAELMGPWASHRLIGPQSWTPQMTLDVEEELRTG